MRNLLQSGLLVGGLLFCLGCGSGGPPPADIEAEAKKLQQDPDYEKQMMGEMSGGSEATE